MDEPYDPIWRHVVVPEQFLKLVCPMAEEIFLKVVGTCCLSNAHQVLTEQTDKSELSGAANHWAMIKELRPYLFQVSPHLLTM